MIIAFGTLSFRVCIGFVWFGYGVGRWERRKIRQKMNIFGNFVEQIHNFVFLYGGC